MSTLYTPAMRAWAVATGLPKGRVRKMGNSDIVRFVHRIYRGGVVAFALDTAAA